jgi:hypothetical protein
MQNFKMDGGAQKELRDDGIKVLWNKQVKQYRTK